VATTATNEPGSAVVAVPAAPTCRRRWLRRLLVLGFGFGILALCHPFLLRWLALGLIINGTDQATDAVVIAGGIGPFAAIPLDEAARRYQDRPGAGIVLVEDRSARTVQLGIVPPLESIVRPRLRERGVPDDAITVLAVTTPGERVSTRRLGAWLADHPDIRVTLLCDELASRRTTVVIRQAMDAEQAGRIHVQPLPDRRFGPDTWYRNRQGIIAVLSEYVALAYMLTMNEEEAPASWDVDKFEQSLKQR
jgi:hypothetical protein